MVKYKVKRLSTNGNFSLNTLLVPYSNIFFNKNDYQYRNIKTGEINTSGLLSLYEQLYDDKCNKLDNPIKVDIIDDWVIEYISTLPIPETAEEQLAKLMPIYDDEGNIIRYDRRD